MTRTRFADRAARAAGALTALALSATGTVAQVIGDGATATSVTSGGALTVIDGGVIAGSNQFHSFEAFSVPQGAAVDFQQSGPEAVSNVIGRVTGPTASVIEGAVSVSIPDANLFLLNPNGVFVGPTASFDVPGALNLSTADELVFQDGAVFSATSPDLSTFSVAEPQAFGFLAGNAAGLTLAGATLSTPDDASTLTLASGNLTLTGATLDGTGGELAIFGPSSAPLASDGVGASGAETAMSTITATGTTITASDGDVLINAGSIAITGGSIESDGGSVLIAADDALTITGDATLATRGIAPDAPEADLTFVINAAPGPDALANFDDANLFNETSGALRIAAPNVRLDTVTANRLDVVAEGGEITQTGLLSFKEGRAPRDLRFTARADRVELAGSVQVFESACAGDCFGDEPEIEIEATDQIDVTGVIGVLTGEARQSSPRAAIKLSAANVFLGSLPRPAPPMAIIVLGADGLEVEATESLVIDRATISLFHDTFEEEAFGFRARAGAITLNDSVVRILTGANYSDCRIAGILSACVTETPNIASGRFELVAENDIAVSDFRFYANTISDYTNGDFSFRSVNGDVTIERTDFFLQSSEDAGGGPGQFFVDGRAVTLSDVEILVLGDEPSPTQPDDYILPNVTIEGETVSLVQTTIALGSAAFGIEFVEAEFSDELPQEERDRVLNQLVTPQAPTGVLTLSAEETLTLSNSSVGTSGIPSSVARPHDGDIAISAGVLVLDSSDILSDIGAAPGLLENSGDITLVVADGLSIATSTISANTSASGQTGDVLISSSGGEPIVIDQSQIFTNSTTLEQSGGAIVITSPDGAAEIPAVVLVQSRLEAVGGPQEARLEVDAQEFIVDTASVTDIGGVIVTPDTSISDAEQQLDPRFLTVAQLLRDRCVARRSGESSTLSYQSNLGARAETSVAGGPISGPQFYLTGTLGEQRVVMRAHCAG